MALRLVTEHDAPTAAVAAVAAVAPTPAVTSGTTAGDITALVALFQGMLSFTEGRILAALAENSRAASERWARHDRELAENTKRVVDRFEKIEMGMEATAELVRDHHAKAHDDEIRMDARIRPIRGSIAWLWTQRRDIIIVLIGIGVFATFMAEMFGRVLGPHAP